MESKKERNSIAQSILTRSTTLYVLFGILALAITVKIIYIQYGPTGNALREESENFKNRRNKLIPALRGDILSYDERTLSTTIPMYNIYMDFKAGGMVDSIFNNNVDSLAFYLSNYFGDRSQREYKALLVKGKEDGSRYKRISPRRVNYIELKKILEFPIYRLGRNKGGVTLDTLFKRELPHGSLARRTIGRANLNTGSMVGIEGYFNDILRGKDGLTKTQKVSGSFWIPIDDPENVDPEDGVDIVTTIDIEVQDVAESMLRTQLTKHEATWGTAILMEVATGEVRAIANLTRQKDGSYFEDNNYALAKKMEPGSTWKLVSSIALLDDAGSTLDEVVETGNGVEYVGRAKVVDTKAHGTLTHREAFEVSSNVGYAKLINKYYAAQPSKLINYLKEIGIDSRFDVPINGEATPVIYSPDDKIWNGLTLTMMSYGYAVMMTPMHTLAIYNAIAGGGKYVAPKFVKRIQKNGQVLREFETKVINPQIASKKTVKELQECMEGVVNTGTARNILKNDNYRVAGKTGTAQVAKGKYGYYHDGGRTYLATIVGYFPAENPVYSCIVAIETFRPDGSGKVYYGGSLSGPVFRAIADKVYSQAVDWGVTAQKPISTKKKVAVAPKKKKHKGHFIKSGDSLSLDLIAKELKLREIEGVNMANVDTTALANVVGMGLKDAIFTLESQGYHVKSQGRGVVDSQSIEAGSQIMPGDTISIVLKY